MVERELIWISGATRSGKTTALIHQFCEWMKARSPAPDGSHPGVLLLAAIGDNRLDLVDRLTAITEGKYPVHSTTPLGFFQDEVTLFYPLLVQELDLKTQFPLRLNPETEQELATQLWQPELDRLMTEQASVNVDRLVRRILDLLQLASLAGLPIDDIPTILQDGLGGQANELPLPFDIVASLLQEWQQWCLDRGLLSYGIIAGLYWQYLLPNETYRQHLAQRYQIVLADDVDEYPAIARHLFQALIDRSITAAFTFNPDGAVRLGLGADPSYLAELAAGCQVVSLPQPSVAAIAPEWGETIAEFVLNPLALPSLPDSIQTIQTTSRADLLRQAAAVIVEAVQTGQIEPKDVVVISPGLDDIARYVLGDSLSQHHISVAALNDQRPLGSFAVIRALLTLLTLVYSGLGRLVDRAAIAEMLVVLSQKTESGRETRGIRHETEGHEDGGTWGDEDTGILNTQPSVLSTQRYPSLRTPNLEPLSLIDPARAGLLADYCFAPHPDRPRLLPANTFPRWDRLGYQASDCYQSIVQWIEQQRQQLDQRLIPSPVALCDRAIQNFFLGGGTLPYEQVAAIRQFIETAQHYWEVQGRLRQGQRHEAPAAMTTSRFIQLLHKGTIAANPYPVRPIGGNNVVTLANVFQYRSSRQTHRWQFWFDVGSSRWLSGVDALFAAPLFLHHWSGQTWTGADTLAANEGRLRRILLDLLGRTQERVFLCHSDLATNGQEQTGILLSLANFAAPYDRTAPL